MWHVLRELSRGTSVYYKQLTLFAGMSLLVLFFVWVGKSIPLSDEQQIKADTTLPAALAPQDFVDRVTYDIFIDKNGNVQIDNRSLSGALTFGDNRDTFLLILTRENKYFIGSLQAKIHLPYPVKDPNDLRPRMYIVHGGEAVPYRLLDSQTIMFEGRDILEGATASVELSFPKSYFFLSTLNNIRSQLAQIPSVAWITLGVLFPLTSLLFMGFILLKRLVVYRRVANNQTFPLPPTQTPPAVLGSLYHGKIGKKEITATLFDLAQRGFIIFHQGINNDVGFGKGLNLFTPQANTLRPYEIFLLHQIFGDETFAAKSEEVAKNLDRELFSTKIAMSIVNIYDSAMAEGFFVKSPNNFYVQYRLAGIIFFFMSLLAILYETFVLPKPDFVLFPWVGMLLASLLIIAATPGLPHRTVRGDQTLQYWIGFRNYLVSREAFADHDSEEFFRFLPYAIVFDCEKEWIARWRKEAIKLPDWFSAENEPHTAEDYENSLVSVIELLAKQIITSRPPTVA